MRDKHRTRSASRLPSALLAWAVLLLCFLYACSCLGAVPPQHGPLCPFHATSFDDDSALYFQPQPVNASSNDACGVSSASCCSPAYLAKVARLQDNISKQLEVNLRVPESVAGKVCQTELNQLRCLPCAADMKGRARLWPPLSDGKPDRRKSVEDVELELCPDYCARLYSACKEALVIASGVKVRQHYPSSSVFCRQHFRELFDVRLQTDAGLCYPVAPGCEYASLGRQYTPCVEHSGTRSLVFFPQTSECRNLPPPIPALPCRVECGRGEYLPWGASECSTCAPGTFSSGRLLRLAQLDPRDYLNTSLPFVTYCADPKGRRLPPSSSCTGWVVDAEGFVDSGKTAHSRQSALEASLNFIEAGEVTFTFQVSSEAGADGLRFFVDGVMLMDLQSDVTRFTTRTFSVSRGNHLLLWTYAKDEGQSKGLDKAILSVIEIKGLRYAQDGACSKCPPGTTSQAGAGDCEMCPANYVAAEAGSSTCEPCPGDQYALPGSAYCWPRAPCHQHSYHYVYSECVNGSRSKVLEWFQPVICNMSNIDPPLRVDGLPCVTKCPAGEYKPEGSDTCQVCADGYYSRSGDRCEACQPGEVALRSLHYKNFTRWADLPGLSTYCSGRCTSGWLLHDTHVESGHGHGRYAQSTLQLVVQVGPLGGKLTFGFSLVCRERCRFEFASSGRVMGEFFTGDADDKEYSLSQGNYTFTWTFTTHRSGDMPSNDHATIWFIRVVGTETGGAGNCMPCQEGTYSPSVGSGCVPCPAGSSSRRGSTQCELCQAGTFSPVAGSKCLACGNGVASVDGATDCSISLTYTTTLALPSRPDRAITFDLAALVQRNKPYGPVLGARGIKYYINVGTREVTRGPCPPGFGCAVYANGSIASLGNEMSYDDNIIDSLSPDSEATEVSREAAIAEGLRLNFTRGDCGGEIRTTTIAFICDPRAGKGAPEFVRENPACHHQFRWRSLFACPLCTKDDMVFDYGKCDNGTRPKVWSWLEEPRQQRCHGGLPLPPTSAVPCGLLDLQTCLPGEYLPADSAECLPCAPGHYSVGAGVIYSAWDPLPSVFNASCAKCPGWSSPSAGATLRSGEGTSTLSARFNFFVEGTIEFSYKVHSSSPRSVFKFFIDAEEKLSLNSTSSLSWEAAVFPMGHGTHVFRWTFTSGSTTTPTTRGNAAELSWVRLWGTDYAETWCQPCPPGTAAQRFGSTECSRCGLHHHTLHDQSSECASCPADEYSLTGLTCTPRPNCTAEDYLEVDGPCVDGRRERTLAPLQPQICLDRGAVFANTTVLPCAACQPGSHPTGSDCATCASGQFYSASTSACEVAPAGYAAVKLRTYFYPDHPSLDPAQQALQISTSAWGDGWSTNCSAVGVCGSGGWRLRGNYMDSGVNIGSVDSYVSLNLTMETEGQLSFEYAGEDTTPGEEGNGLLLFVNGEFTDLPYVSPSSADATATSPKEAWQWRSYSRFLPAGELLLVWSYHQDNGTAGASRAMVRRIQILGASSGGGVEWSLKTCGEGTFSAAPGSTGCQPCPPGHANPSLGASLSCEPCEVGHFAQAGSKACLPCGQGTVSRKGAAYCSAPDLCTFTAVPSGSQYRLGALQHRGGIGPLAEANEKTEVLMSLCEPLTDNVCRESSGRYIHPFVCERERSGLGNGSDAGSMLAFEELAVGSFRLVFTPQSQSVADATCPDGLPPSTIINFRCGAKEHGRGAPVRISAAEDSLADCHRMYKWISIYACHLCDADDYRKVVGLCDEGKRLTTWVPLDDRSCFEPYPKPFTDILDNCVEEIRFPVYTLALVSVGGAVLLAVMALVSVRNRVIQRRYVGSAKASNGNEIEMQFMSSGDQMLVPDDFDRLYKRE